jgi:hypothetical protein
MCLELIVSVFTLWWCWYDGAGVGQPTALDFKVGEALQVIIAQGWTGGLGLRSLRMGRGRGGQV